MFDSFKVMISQCCQNYCCVYRYHKVNTKNDTIPHFTKNHSVSIRAVFPMSCINVQQQSNVFVCVYVCSALVSLPAGIVELPIFFFLSYARCSFHDRTRGVTGSTHAFTDCPRLVKKSDTQSKISDMTYITNSQGKSTTTTKSNSFK